MKKLLVFLFAVTAGILSGAVNDVKVTQQVVLTPPTFKDNLIPFESALTSTLASYRSGMGLGTEDSPQFTGLTLSGQLTSTLATGTAPFVVTSTTQVANLNAATAGSAGASTTVATIQTSTNASYFPLFVASSTNGNQAASLGTGLTFNPSTNNLSTTTFTGALSGNATTATSSTTATNATNTAITDDTTTNATVYPTWVTTTTGNLPQKVSSTKLTFNPSTGALAATSFAGNTAASSITGTTLASNVVTSSLTTVGALTSGSIGSGFGSINVGSNSITGGAGTFSGLLRGDAGMFATGSATAATGVGVEVLYDSTFKGIVQTFNRSTGLFEKLSIGGLITELQANGSTVATITSTGLNNTVIGATTPADAGFNHVGMGIAAQSYTPLYTLGPADNYAAYFQGNSGTGHSFGPLIGAGTNSSDFALRVKNQTFGSDYFAVRGDGLVSAYNGLAVTGVINQTGGSGSVWTYGGGGGGLELVNSTDTSATKFLSFDKSTGSTIGSIARVTTTDAVALYTTSDGRLKTNYVGRDFSAADAGRIIDGLRPTWFDWKPTDLTETVEEQVATGKKDKDGKAIMEKHRKLQKVTDAKRIADHIANNKSIVGFIAQEENAVDPLLARIGAVTVGDDDPDTITKQWQRSDTALIPILVAELKSLRARLAAEEAKSIDFEARLQKLEKK